jgi:hypothetical protein
MSNCAEHSNVYVVCKILEVLLVPYRCMAQRVAVFSLGFACGMATMLGLGVHAAQRIASEVAEKLELAAAHAVQQAEAMLQEFAQKHRLSSSRGTEEVPSGVTEVHFIDSK